MHAPACVCVNSRALSNKIQHEISSIPMTRTYCQWPFHPDKMWYSFQFTISASCGLLLSVFTPTLLNPSILSFAFSSIINLFSSCRAKFKIHLRTCPNYNFFLIFTLLFFKPTESHLICSKYAEFSSVLNFFVIAVLFSWRPFQIFECWGSTT